MQRTLTHFVRGSITVWLTSGLTGFDSAALFMFNQQQIYLFGQIQTSQTGGQLHSDTSPYKVSECSLVEINKRLVHQIQMERKIRKNNFKALL